MKKENKAFKTNHLKALANLFIVTEAEANRMFGQLRRAECKLNRLFNAACERNLTGHEEAKIEHIKTHIKSITNNVKGLYFNSDPRGYSIKIDDSVNRKLRNKGVNLYSDWGGYGILAPDFN